MLTPAEVDEVKQLVGKDTREEHDQQPDLDPEDQQIPTDPDRPVVPEITENPEAIAIDIEHNSLLDDNDDYHNLKNEYLDLLEKVKVQPLKTRQRLPKLKNDKNLKGMIKILDKVIAETSQDDMDLTTINQKQYTEALVITNKILPPKLQVMKTNIGKTPAWQQTADK